MIQNSDDGAFELIQRIEREIDHPENPDSQDIRAAARAFAGELLVETCQAERGTSAVCIREAQRSLAQSSKRLIESKIAALGLGHRFKIFTDKIETPGDGIIIFRGMQDHTADSIKSLEGFRIA